MSDLGAEVYLVTIERNESSGAITRETWEDPGTGKLNRTTGAAETLHYESRGGRLWRSQEFMRQGQPYREGDMPAQVVTDLNTGIEVCRTWYDPDSGKCGRPGGKPCYIKIDPDTEVVVEEEYREAGELHRMDGPARVARDPKSGKVISASYYVHGLQVNASEPGPL